MSNRQCPSGQTCGSGEAHAWFVPGMDWASRLRLFPAPVSRPCFMTSVLAHGKEGNQTHHNLSLLSNHGPWLNHRLTPSAHVQVHNRRISLCALPSAPAAPPRESRRTDLHVQTAARPAASPPPAVQPALQLLQWNARGNDLESSPDTTPASSRWVLQAAPSIL